jgi:alpha-D-ribose 1-methylphosphonate 5-triphosphate synthase subunit PhnI
MGYIAVRGGTQAIEASIERLKYERLRKGPGPSFRNIEAGMRALIDQVMPEASLYSEEVAAAAIRQAEGSPEEAVFLMRAFRSTLPRLYYSLEAKSEDMRIERRISASFKDIPGGQVLGASCDYTHRLISLEEETEEEARLWVQSYLQKNDEEKVVSKHQKVTDYLRAEGLLKECTNSDEDLKMLQRLQLSSRPEDRSVFRY